MSIFAAGESITTHSIHHRLLFKGFTVQKGYVAKRFLFFICAKSTNNFLKKVLQFKKYPYLCNVNKRLITL